MTIPWGPSQDVDAVAAFLASPDAEPVRARAEGLELSA